jgi:hypothetical protein
VRSADNAIIFGVASDPKPEHSIRNFDAESAMVKTGPRRPISPNFFEVKRRMFGIVLQQRKSAVGNQLNRSGQCSVAPPEIG